MQRARRRLLGIAIVVVAVALAALTLSPDRVLARLAALRTRPAAFAAVVAALYLVRPLVAWPLSLCSAVVGYGYGLVGLPFALVGVCATCLPPYFLGRYAGSDADTESGVLGRLSGSGERFFERTGGVRGVAAARLAPLPADPVSVGAGLSGVGLRAYLLGTLLGEIPWTIAAVLAGRSLDRLATAGLAGASVELAVVAGVIALLVLAGPTYEFLRERWPHQNVSEQS
ncbi:TVP38/TMEM64 family protein [Halococcus agarilyticus]|uniref:TVP38/TMEM64 family protein n=1 Tax=Halococcus agarilyticus TaxID=1232219 RepID=UPI000AF5F4E0|nr:VTT domain-containing protein [Halococcus agarilyticus]